MNTKPQDNPSTEPELEYDIRHLAYHIWQTAGHDFSQTALGFWAMAERMIVEKLSGKKPSANSELIQKTTKFSALFGPNHGYLDLVHPLNSESFFKTASELTADSVRRTKATTAAAVETAAAWPAALHALYHYRVRELARGMWAASAEQRDRSLDYWLAAEQHLRLLAESAVRTAGAGLGQEEALARTFETFSSVDYLEQLRTLAYELWETAENQQRSALEFWLAAENRFLESLAAGATAAPSARAPAGTPTS